MATRKLKKKETLGRYKILREIGRGGSGVVYEGWDPKEGRKVALKVLPAIRALDPDRVQRFLREAENASHLDHENIVSLHEIGREGRNYFLVMQYIEGRPLDVLWKEEIIDFHASVSVVIHGLDALEYAHAKSLIHLDVKPQNILVDNHGKAYLTDFGLARAAGRARKEGAVAGTPKYMSPEQASGASSVDERSDLYSLGVTLYNLLTYTHPFEGDDVHIILKNIISGDFPRPRDINNRIPTRLEAVVLKAMERKPSRRYQTASEFRADLESFLKGESVTASVPILKRRGFRTLLDKRVLYAVLVLAVAAVGALVLRKALDTARTPQLPSTDGLQQRRKEVRKLSAEGDRFLDEGKLIEAMAAYNRVLELTPDDPITLANRGLIHARRSAWKRAEADFTAALELDPALGLARLGRGEVRVEQGDFEGARNDLELALSSLANREDTDETRALCSNALTGLGRAALETGDPGRAARKLMEALDRNPDNPRAHLFLGLTYLEKGDRPRAFEEIKKVTELEPTNLQAKLELERLKLLEVAGLRVQVPVLQAGAHLNQGRYRQAIEFCREALKIEPGNLEARVLCARAKLALGKAREALKELDAALLDREATHELLVWRARALRLNGRPGPAAADARAALDKQADSAMASRELGLSLDALKDFRGAEKALARAADLAPSDVEVREILLRLYMEGKKFDRAATTAEELIALAPRNLGALEARALAGWRLGHNEKAFLDAEKALALESDLPGAHLVRAGVLLARNAGEARDSARKAAVSGRLRLEAWRLEMRACKKLDDGPGLRAASGRLLEKLPHDGEALALRGTRSLSDGDFAGALADFRSWADSAPEVASAWEGLARALAGSKRYEEALEAAIKASQLEPGPASQCLLGSVRLGMRDYEGALRHLENARAGLSPEDPAYGPAQLREAKALRALGRPAVALAFAVEARKSGQVGAGFLETEILLDLGEIEKARSASQSLDLPPESPGFRWIRAREQLLRGEARAALGLFQSLERDAPADPAWVLLYRGTALRLLGRPVEGLDLLNLAVRRDPRKAPLRVERARLLRLLGRVSECLQDLDLAVRANPEDPALRLLRAETAGSDEARRETSLADLQAASKAFPRDPKVFRLRTRLHLAGGDTKAALKDLERLEVLLPGDWKIPAERARTLAKVFRFGEEARAWARVERLKTGFDPALVWKRLQAHLMAGEYEACLAGVERFPDEEAWRGRVLLLRGRAELGLDRFEEAIGTAGAVLRAAPSMSLEAKSLRARAYVLRGAKTHRPGEPAEDFVKAYVNIQAHYPQALRDEGLQPESRGRVFTVMGLYQMTAEGNLRRAVEDFRRALSACPSERDAHRYLGAVATRGSESIDPDRGLTHLAEALRMGHPDRAGIHLDRGRSLQALGRMEEAGEAYRLVLASDPGHEEARRALASLERG